MISDSGLLFGSRTV